MMDLSPTPTLSLLFCLSPSRFVLSSLVVSVASSPETRSDASAPSPPLTDRDPHGRYLWCSLLHFLQRSRLWSPSRFRIPLLHRRHFRRLVGSSHPSQGYPLPGSYSSFSLLLDFCTLVTDSHKLSSSSAVHSRFVELDFVAASPAPALILKLTFFQTFFNPARTPSRTLVDPLEAFVTAFASNTDDFAASVKAGVDAAADTANFEAKAGRAAYGECTLSSPFS